VRIPYNAEKDAEFYEPPAEPHSQFMLSAGSIAVFHPQDAHQPGVMIGQPSEVHKVVIKFRL
jgi:YhcH/YjgK/YiaL family protein